VLNSILTFYAFEKMNYPAASSGVSIKPSNAPRGGELNPVRLK